MSIKSKQKKAFAIVLAGKMTVVKGMKTHSDDPAFKAKAERAKAFIEKHGIPKSFKEENK